MKRSWNFAPKIGENAKIGHLMQLTPKIWLQIQNFQAILVQGTVSFPNIYFQEVSHG